MSSRQARNERRAAERKAKKSELRHAKAAGLLTEDAGLVPPGYQLEQEFSAELMAQANAARDRVHRNRLNAQHSTGPRTTEGKSASSRNSLKHGLASGEIIIPGEDPARFEALLYDLLEEHQPANPTEDLLVNEMAQSYWLTQRALRFQNECFSQNGVDEKRLALFLRYQTTHDRAFHKALNTLLKLRKQRGSVSQNQSPERSDGTLPPRFVSQADVSNVSKGEFVRQNPSPEPILQELNASKAA